MLQTMVVNTLANLGAIILNIYILFKISGGFAHQEQLTRKQICAAILCETIVGMLLMNFSYVAYNTRFDLRFLLFAFSMKYLGWKVTVPTIFNLAVGRFFFEVSDSSWANLLWSILVMVTLTMLHEWAQKRMNDKRELQLLITYLIAISFLFGLFLTKDFQKTIAIYIIYGSLAYGTAFVLYSVLRDMERVLSLVKIDDLTQLNNFRKFQEDRYKADYQEGIVSIALIDIDHFKQYNDRYGHQAGDLILQEISKIFATYCTYANAIYRIGGEEFAVLIQGDRQSAVYLMEKIQKRVKFLTIQLSPEDTVTVTLSIGIAQRQPNESLQQTQERADQALYFAKRNGRDQLSIN
ncbi:GGDEF domain-containing protein [Enterococcus sp. N249-2]